ncbi:MAG: Tol-Pal system beta propeller repeat protein TolB [Pseudomonadota bacterium]
MKRFLVPLFLLGFLLSSPSARAAKIFINITQASNQSFPIALPPPVRDGGDSDASELGQLFTSTIQQDLELMSIFRFIDPKSFLEDPKKKAFREGEIDFANWAVLDAFALAKGWYQVRGTKVTIEMHLFDVLAKKELVAKKYDTTSDSVPAAAHKFANQIMLALTGEAGLFESRIAFVGDKGGSKELYAMDFNGANQRRLTNLNSIVLSPNWAEDGRGIFFTAFPRRGSSQLYMYDFRTGSATRKTNLPGMVIGLKLDPISRSMVTTLSKEGNSDIYFLNPDGTIQKRLTTDPDIDVSPSFSPDGQQIVFVSSRDGSAQIYKMARAGSQVKRLTFKGNNNTSPAWSPRGDKVLFAGMDTDGHFDIFSMNTDGGGMVRLTYDSRNNEEPAWSPDGQMIAFSSNRAGAYQLYIMRPDGSHQAQLTHDLFKHTMPAWSPKEK